MTRPGHTAMTPHPLDHPAAKRPRLALATLTTLVLAAALQACSSVPASNPALDQARSRLEAARLQPELTTLAHAEWLRARQALDRAERAQRDGDSLATVNHLSYMATQHVVVAEETARSRAAQAVTAGAAAERDRMRLQQRTQQADAAERRLGDAERTNARQGAELASNARAIERSAAELGAAERDNARKAAELAQSAADAQAERNRLAERDARVADLEAQLKAMDARRTERGLVVTLGDLLFDSGQSRLHGDGLRSVDRLAEFLVRNPSRMAVIEGYTDSVGGADANLDLSGRRARAVMDALLQKGVEPSRLRTQAYGEVRPVADNATARGRQMNRRVEVVFATEAGDLLLK